MGRDADRALLLSGRCGRDDAPNALGVSRLVEGQQGREVIARARVDQVDATQIPASGTEPQLQERAVGGGDLEAHPRR